MCWTEQWKMSLALGFPRCLLVTPQSWHVASGRIQISCHHSFLSYKQISYRNIFASSSKYIKNKLKSRWGKRMIQFKKCVLSFTSSNFFLAHFPKAWWTKCCWCQKRHSLEIPPKTLKIFYIHRDTVVFLLVFFFFFMLAAQNPMNGILLVC